MTVYRLWRSIGALWYSFSACDKLTDGRAHSDKMVRSIKPDLKRASPEKPLMVIKHHLFTNFTEYGIEEPTWINVAREPVSRFVSSYYFRRFGFNRHSGARNKKVLDGTRDMDMVSFTFNRKWSKQPSWNIHFLTPNQKLAKLRRTNLRLENTRIRLICGYFFGSGHATSWSKIEKVPVMHEYPL